MSDEKEQMRSDVWITAAKRHPQAAKDTLRRDIDRLKQTIALCEEQLSWRAETLAAITALEQQHASDDG